MSTSFVNEALHNIARAAEPEINLAHAALLIGYDEYPGLDIGAYLGHLDTYARSIAARLPAGANYEVKIGALNQFLFEDEGFTGNATDFYDPRNSFLNAVIDRKLGIPITLSVLYMEVGQRIGLQFAGVSFPGHFLVKLPLDNALIVIDPFNGGIALDEDDLKQRLRQTYGDTSGPATAPVMSLLASASKKQILLRMLRNLKAVYVHRGEGDKALAAINRALILAPNAPEELRDRGDLYRSLECFRSALADYTAYLARKPDAMDAAIIRERVLALQKIATRLN